MIRVFIFITTFFFATGVHSQEWFPLGASWYYNQIILLEGESYSYFEVTDEIIINGRTCKNISGSCNCSMPGLGGYFYQEGDKIFLYNPGSSDSLKLLYDFTLVAGDTLTIKGDSLVGGDGTFVIDSVTTMQFGSATLRVQHITELNPQIGWGNKIIEHMGANGCLYPQVSFCDPSTGGLRCYEDEETGLINFQTPPRSCAYVTGTKGLSVLPLINVYPNPSTDIVQIHTENLIDEVVLFNNFSIPVYRQSSIFNTDFEFEVWTLPAGLYHIRVVLTDHQVVHWSVVVQK